MRTGPLKSTTLFPASIFAEGKPDAEPIHDSCGGCRYYLSFEDEDEDGDLDVDEEDEDEDENLEEDEEEEDGEPEVDEEDEEDENPDELGAKSRMGSCRRYPPQIDSHGDTIFPAVFSNDWCGEFLPTL